jgi:hypothetical protein
MQGLRALLFNFLTNQKMEAQNAGSVYNQLSEEMLAKIPPLKRGETAKYRVSGSYDPVSKKYRLVTAIHIPTTDVIYDEGKDEWVNIAMIERMMANGNAKFIDLWLTDSTNNVIILNGSKNIDQKIYRYFELCNYNTSNPNRDPSVNGLIEKIDDIANYMAEHQKSVNRRGALKVVQNWSDDEVIEYWQGIDASIRVALRAKNGKDIDQKYLAYLKARLYESAESNPEQFIEAVVNNIQKPDDVEGIIKQAKEKGLFKLDMKTGVFLYADGSVLYKFKKKFGSKPYEILKDYFIKDDDGRKVFENLKTEVVS